MYYEPKKQRFHKFRKIITFFLKFNLIMKILDEIDDLNEAFYIVTEDFLK